MVPLSSELIPTDGLTHIVTWKINNPGLELHIDGVETSTSHASVGFTSHDNGIIGEWCGHDHAGFGKGAENVAVGGVLDEWKGGITSGLEICSAFPECITFDHSPTDIGELFDRRQLPTTFTVTTTIPQDQKGCLFEAGATGRGTWVGIVQRGNDYYFRLQAGEGTRVGDESDTDTAVIMVPLSSELIPTDGLTHIVTWKINNPGLELHIDGVETSTSHASVGFLNGDWCGPNHAGFGKGAQHVSVGGILDEWQGEVTSGLEICSAFPE